MHYAVHSGDMVMCVEADDPDAAARQALSLWTANEQSGMLGRLMRVVPENVVDEDDHWIMPTMKVGEDVGANLRETTGGTER